MQSSDALLSLFFIVRLSHFKDRFDGVFHEYIFKVHFNTFQTELNRLMWWVFSWEYTCRCRNLGWTLLQNLFCRILKTALTLSFMNIFFKVHLTHFKLNFNRGLMYVFSCLGRTPLRNLFFLSSCCCINTLLLRL